MLPPWPGLTCTALAHRTDRPCSSLLRSLLPSCCGIDASVA